MEPPPIADFAPPYVLLEDRVSAEARARLYARPEAVVRCDDPHEVEAAIREIERGLSGGFHAAGFFSYELGYALEPRLLPLMPPRRSAPLICFGLFGEPGLLNSQELDEAFARMGPPPQIASLRPGLDRAAHAEKVARILDLIGAGDVYQVNLTFPLHFEYGGDPLRLYGALRAGQPVAHGGVAAFDGLTALSVSPELWFEVRGDEATTRPMKGTCARGRDPEADAIARRTLAADPKQRAENLMIVDLMRNDLSRLATPGSVKAPHVFTVETYPGFHALTSTVTAHLEPGHALRDRLAALFPCGSIVGAPKIRAGEIIRDLEPEPRGVYTGGLGALQPNGDMSVNVAIRTAVLTAEGKGVYGVGGGIVADSDPDAEYDEALLKGRVLTDLARPYELIETLRWSSDGGFVRVGFHLSRLAGSARQLGFRWDLSRVEAAFGALAGGWTSETPDQRVRLLLSPDGAVALTHADVQTGPAVLRLGLATHRLDPADPFLRHKTTRRDAYDHAFREAERMGLDEALFLNRRGEVAEASRHSVFVPLDGRLATPPLEAGLLPGVLRASLLSSGEAVERSFTLGDLRRASAIFVGNSLHGLRPATLAIPPG